MNICGRCGSPIGYSTGPNDVELCKCSSVLWVSLPSRDPQTSGSGCTRIIGEADYLRLDIERMERERVNARYVAFCSLCFGIGCWIVTVFH